MAGVLILGTLIGLALAAPWVTRYSPTVQDLHNTLKGPSSEHWLGTDQLGRDVWSRLVYAGRVDLKVGFLAVLLPFLIGTVLGSLAGFYGGKLDTLVGYFVNVVVAFPFYVLIIAMLFALGPGERSIYIAITLVGWVSYTAHHSSRDSGRQTPRVRGGRQGGRVARFPHHRPPPVAERDHAGRDLRDVGHRALASLRSSRSVTSASASSLRRRTGAR